MSILKDLTIPMMGSVENARLLKWFIKEGDSFAKGDILYELETDKTVTEVEADAAGILARCLAEEGDEFRMGDRVGLQAPADTDSAEIAQALAALDGDGSSAGADPDESSAPTGGESEPAPSVADRNGVGSPRPPESGPVPVKSSPRSRKLAREHGIDIATLTGTGPRGRITGEDVLKAAAADSADATVSIPTHDHTSVSPAGGKTEDLDVRPTSPTSEVEGTVVPHSLRRKTIAKNMAASKREVPHLTADMDIDLSELMALRKRYKASGQSAPSILAIFATHTARLLVEHKQLNATYRENEMILWDSVNLNIGVDTEEGLVVPVIRDAQLMTAMEMTTQIAGVAVKARNGSLKPADMAGGTFTISNPGSLGPVVRAEAVLNGPQVALLGMPGIVNKPVAVAMADGSFATQVRPVIRIGVTFDHRALDGGHVIRFLNALKFAIENINA